MKNKNFYLYMDTSDHLILGLLNEQFEWIRFIEVEGNKNTGKIHPSLHELLSEQGILFSDLKAIFQNAGPGSYTGMRVSEGISQIFEWQQIPVFTFLNFEVPLLLGVKEGVWLGKAFKGEFFLYEWNLSKTEQKLVPLDIAKTAIQPQKTYCHYSSALAKDFVDESQSFLSTGAMINEKSKELFSQVLTRAQRVGPYYYRTLEQEFKVSG